MTYWVRSLLPIEKKSAGIRSMATAAAGVSTMMPRGGISAATPAARSSARQAAKTACASCELARGRHHRQHHLERPADGGAQQRADLGPEQLGPIQAQAQSAQAEEGVALRRAG